MIKQNNEKKYCNMILVFLFLGIFFQSCEKDPTLNNNNNNIVATPPQPDCDPIIIDDSLFNLIRQYDTLDTKDAGPDGYLYRIIDLIATGQCSELTVSYAVGFVLKGEGFMLVWNGEIIIDETGSPSVNLYLVHTIFPYTTWDPVYGFANTVQIFNMGTVTEKMNVEYPYTKTVTVNVKTYWYHEDKKFIYNIK